ncbi:M24 family metallopeptidase [Planococcaceae bacterium Storch 2/2-2]|nr:M24 family metallopeptidase [Planococcaceae bacterium Storch 2/2-2]
MNKIERIRQRLHEESIDALLVTNPYNRRYMANFTGTAGVVFITKEEALFITDFRYVEQATEQAVGYTVVEQRRTVVEQVADEVVRLGVRTLGFEKDHMTYGEFEIFEEYVDAMLVPVSGWVEQLRLIKTEDELAILQRAADIADETFEHICTYIRPGVSELDVANEMERYMRSLGATQSSFDSIVASGVRGALPHGVASDKLIEEGELVTLDFGALYNGYISDITRTVAVGEPSEQMKEVYEIVLAAQKRGVEQIRPGMKASEADQVVRDVIVEKGYGEAFGHSTGHGIGLEVHEMPALSSRNDTVLQCGMTVTVEPGIYLPGIGGVRIEDDIVLTETGNRRLTKSSKELRILPTTL